MRLIAVAASTSLLVLAAACGANGESSGAPVQTGAPLETRPANNSDQKPAFAGQTRAPGVVTQARLMHTVVAEGLQNPWGLALLPDGRWLVTEKPGRLRVVTAEGQISDPVQGLPAVDARGQGGLLDVITSPTFGQDRLIYWSYAEPRQGGNGTAVARARLSDDLSRVENVQVIFRVQPTYDGDKHFGSSLAFAPDGTLFITVGERSDKPMRPQAQDLSSHLGKTIRINADGSVPQDNPFVGQAGARPEIWSFGHRNAQGVAIQPGTGAVWTVEHGAQGGDEVNLDKPGLNYGWPDAAYGVEYGGAQIGEGATQHPGTEQPVYYWDPVIAPGGAVFYEGPMFPNWNGNLLVAGLREKHIARLVIQNDRVVGEERLLSDLGERIRDVAVGPDGSVWAISDERNGKLVRLSLAQ
ncbi:glucose/arabinose dehydrogenase [Brevundimonas nasdae]|uniref:PQQ-dependent sugar dehydrogenase n=2 Tax=Alphaproteobacteria TaxID=28211 RepID=A0ABX8TEC1_9CAUL|nr:PQQ-dependent sugar dehydrogenase [Brevundimonas nasdae]MBK6025193.1 PQQ-dependent sugar dehydrogenase [Brevundimonas nasdae]MDQ0452025.1 glucose/arabinose dehydrogenase [Brevundimonas nasdae]QYC09533.1 PQQ-dependent sugar dehydrogenase [Brevundimonas nasdae]QYC15582.1 PQQ-dependent sugar dehydrogenase [Brevundimonas nasdae]